MAVPRLNCAARVIVMIFTSCAPGAYGQDRAAHLPGTKLRTIDQPLDEVMLPELAALH